MRKNQPQTEQTEQIKNEEWTTQRVEMNEIRKAVLAQNVALLAMAKAMKENGTGGESIDRAIAVLEESILNHKIIKFL